MSVKSLVKSTLLLGSSSAANTLIGIVRVKLLALLVGPAGLGILGTLAGISGAATTLFAVGTNTSATRRLALERDDPAAVTRIRRALLAIGFIHGLAAGVLFWLAREPISRWVFATEAYAFEVGLLGIAVALTLVAGLQIALLQGLGRVGDIARLGPLGSLIGSVVGLVAVWQWGLGGLIVLILAQPACAALLARVYSRATIGLPDERVRDGAWPSARDIAADWRSMVGEGAAFMLSHLLLALVPLAVRALVIHDLGLEAAGYFHAAWTMSVIYIGFLFHAMSADFFPRLAGLVGDRDAASGLINDQAQVGLAICGPILLVMLAGSPWLVPLLYSKAFMPAAGVIEWQALGNLMKIAGWPVAFLSMARGRSLQFLGLEIAWTTLFVGLVWLGLPYLGLEVTGIAFAVACTAYLVLSTIVAGITFGFAWQSGALRMMLAFASAGVLTLVAARHSAVLQAVVGLGFAGGLGLASLRHILTRTGAEGRVATLVGRAFASVGWPLPSVLATSPR